MQTSLAAARKTIAADNSTGQPAKAGAVSPPPEYDSDDGTSTISHTTGGSTPNIPYILDFGPGRDTNNALNAVNNLVNEFDNRKQAFDDDVKAIEERSLHLGPNINPVDELKRLKLRFEAWKQEYKARLRETRSKVHRSGNHRSGYTPPEPERNRRKWWEKIGSNHLKHGTNHLRQKH